MQKKQKGGASDAPPEVDIHHICRYGSGSGHSISAGPVNTLAARGIAGFTQMLKHYEERAPLKRNLEPKELGTTGLFLASDMSTATTGQVVYVDCGYEIMGL